jgi:hypothetical protein
VYLVNAEKQGPDVKRKNGCIVNTGNKVSREELKKRVKENKERYEVSEEEREAIELPKPDGIVIIASSKEKEPAGMHLCVNMYSCYG